nr:ATP synthase subunit 6 [Laemobothrion sp.]
MTSLFSVFDPLMGGSLMVVWWLSCLISILMISSYWTLYPRSSLIYLFIKKNLEVESMRDKSESMILVTVVYSVFSLNMENLIPLSFPFLSHLSFGICLSLPVWWGIVVSGVSKAPQGVLAHFLPPGTPWGMVPLVVPVELMGYVLRPFTLALRLMMNTMIGHILMAILTPSGVSGLFLPMIFLYELAVMIIQAWIVALLVNSYMEENS